MEGLFDSYFLGGFECSSHRRPDGRRLDLITATGHDRAVIQDYRFMLEHGIRTVRDGVRWHLIETAPARYDWSSFLPMLRAAEEVGIQVMWDLCHYGWPDHLDIWRPGFIEGFARFAAAVATVVREETDRAPLWCPINEISYWAWAGGTVARFNPNARGRGAELKQQLVRASIAAIEAVWSVDRRARIVQIDPVINVVPRSSRPQNLRVAEAHRQAQFEAWDMLVGWTWPGLGGRPAYLDVIGVNYYSDNQWFVGGRTIGVGHPRYRPFREILAETYQRYQRPIFVAETGGEGVIRVPWLRYVGEEVRAAVASGIPVEGICLYPIVDYPGWTNLRHCEVGLLGPLDERGHRAICLPLADEVRRQQALFENWIGSQPDSAAATGSSG